MLESEGFEPRVEDGTVHLGNCPFHHLAQRHTDLVCGMNLHLVGGLLDELGSSGYTARLRPSPDNCCVVLETDDDRARDACGSALALRRGPRNGGRGVRGLRDS